MVRDAPAFKLPGGVEIELLASPIPKCSTLQFSTNAKLILGGSMYFTRIYSKNAEVTKAQVDAWHWGGFWRCRPDSTI